MEACSKELEIISEIPPCVINGKANTAKYVVRCYCGNIFISNKYAILAGMKNKKGGTRSCGCLFKEMRKSQATSLKHGLVKKNRRLYHIWHSMKSRCYSEINAAYDNYGGRGITVCDDWQNAEIFYEWAIGNGYGNNLTIDRIDNNGNYEPENCRWVTMSVQASNKSNNINYEYQGQTKNLSQWSSELGISLSILYRRINIWKLPLDEAFLKTASKPFLNQKGFVFNSDINLCIKNKLIMEGRKQSWVIKKIREKGIFMPTYLFSLKINSKEYFTTKELVAINEVLGTNFK